MISVEALAQDKPYELPLGRAQQLAGKMTDFVVGREIAIQF